MNKLSTILLFGCICLFFGCNAFAQATDSLRYFSRKNASESDLLKALKITRSRPMDKSTADSLQGILNSRYPSGSLAKLVDYKKVTTESDLEKMRGLAEAFLDKYSQKNAVDWFDKSNHINHGSIYSISVVLNVINNNYAIIKKYIDELPYSSLQSIYYKTIQIQHDRKDIKDQDLYYYSDLLIKRFEYFRDHPMAVGGNGRVKDWNDQFNRNFAKNVLPTHIEILYNTGKKIAALAYAKLAEQYLEYKKASVNGIYALLLAEKGNESELNNLLVKSAYVNQCTPEMVEMLKKQYVKDHSSDNGFEAYLESLKNSRLKSSIQQTLQGSVLNKVVPEFGMYDGNGKLVKSSDLLGKIVVLDFWATWCVPCKASFPGMKLSVTKYKADPDVVFYFVDTEERRNSYKRDVLAYLKTNSFPFQVLFDNRAEGENTTGEVFHSMCKAFTISGIPQKLVIDRNGKLRFISVGYHGSPTGLADEISAMIDYVKLNP